MDRREYEAEHNKRYKPRQLSGRYKIDKLRQDIARRLNKNT